MLLTLMGCNNQQNNTSMFADYHAKEIKIPQIEQSNFDITQYVFNQFKRPLHKFFEYITYINKIVYEVNNEKIDACTQAIYVLKPEWNESFCDPLLEERRLECINEIQTLVPPFIMRLCTILIHESNRTFMDPLLSIAIMKNESNFGVIQNNNISMNTNLVTIPMKYIQEIINNSSIQLNNGRIVRAKIIQTNHNNVLIDTGLAGEGGLFQLIRPNYYAGRPIPGTDNTIPNLLLNERRQFITENMEANIKIGIEELIRHRNVFPKNERTHWWFWISCYNTGSTNRHARQWKIYSSRILKHYARICQNDFVRNIFDQNCSNLRLYRWYWE